MRKKQNNKENINQTSFYFEDYLETNQMKKEDKNFSIVQDRIYLLFFYFVFNYHFFNKDYFGFFKSTKIKYFRK